MARNQITTVDIGTNSVKIMELGLTQNGLNAINFGSMNYPRNSSLEKISDEVIIDTIKQIIKEKGLKTKSVALSIPRQYVTTKGLSGLPVSAGDDEIIKMVPMQIESELPFTVDESVYSIYNLQRSRDNVSLEVVASKRTLIERFLDISEKAGFKLEYIIPSSFATYAIIFDQFKDSLANKNIAFADIGAGGTDMGIVQHGRLAFSRSFTHGGNNLTSLFEKEYGLLYDDAEGKKIKEANLHIGFRDPLTIQWANILSIQIAQSIKAFTGKEINESIDALWLCGRGSQIPGLDTYLSEKLGIEVISLNQLHSIENYIIDQDKVPQEKVITVNLGLGVIALGGKDRTSTVNVNLLPKEIIEKAKRARKKLLAIVSSIIVFIAVAFGAWGIWTWRESNVKSLKDIDAQIQKLDKDVAIIHAKEALERSILMEKVMTPYVMPLEILREMHERLPNRDKIAFTNLQLDRTGKMTISIEAMSHADIGETIRILNNMKYSEDKGLFSDVKNGAISKITKDNRPILQVQITCTLNKDVIQEEKNEKNNKS